jgi:hypothetical protein
MKDYWLNVVTVKATKDVYFNYKKGIAKLELREGNLYKVLEVFTKKMNYNEVPADTRYTLTNGKRLISSTSKCILDSWGVKFVKQEYIPYNSCFLRKEDMIE